LFYGVNLGRNVIEFCPEFTHHVERLAGDNGVLMDEIKSTDRFKQAVRKFGLPAT
jgi:hypothetical protein